MSAMKKWRKAVKAMIDGEGMTMVCVGINGNGHIECRVSLDGNTGCITTSGTPSCRRTHLNTRAQIRRMARKLAEKKCPCSKRVR